MRQQASSAGGEKDTEFMFTSDAPPQTLVNTAPASGRNHIAISRTRDFTRTRIGDETIFAFHADGDCPGYTVKISGWKLRKAVVLPGDGHGPVQEARPKPVTQLRKIFGEEFFRESRRVLAEGNEEIRVAMEKFDDPFSLPSVGIAPLSMARVRPRRDEYLAELRRALNEKYVSALRKDLFSPPVALLSVPMACLCLRDGGSYFIEKEPWPFSVPPESLDHLEKEGFDHPDPWGIIASPPGGGDVWVVSGFSRFGVDVQWDLKAALQKEYPWLEQIGDWLSKLDLTAEGVKEANEPPEPLTLEETVLLKIAMDAPKLDGHCRVRPGHWEVFLAAWKERMSAYDMARRKKWNRRTASARLSAVEQRFFRGAKVSEFLFDPSVLRSVEGQLRVAHAHSARKVYRPTLLGNTRTNENENEPDDK